MPPNWRSYQPIAEDNWDQSDCTTCGGANCVRWEVTEARVARWTHRDFNDVSLLLCDECYSRIGGSTSTHNRRRPDQSDESDPDLQPFSTRTERTNWDTDFFAPILRKRKTPPPPKLKPRRRRLP